MMMHGYEKVYADAHAYYQHRPRPDGAAGTPGTDAHWLAPTREHGLRQVAVGRFEGTRAQVVATAEAYGKDRNLVMYDDQPGVPLRARVTTADGRGGRGPVRATMATCSVV